MLRNGNFNFFLLKNTLIWRPFWLAYKSRVLLAEWLPVLRDRNNSGNKGGNNMQQIESSVAMVTKPLQWEEFAAWISYFPTSFDKESWLNQLDKIKREKTIGEKKGKNVNQCNVLT